MGCNYLSLPLIPASGIKLLQYIHVILNYLTSSEAVICLQLHQWSNPIDICKIYGTRPQLSTAMRKLCAPFITVTHKRHDVLIHRQHYGFFQQLVQKLSQLHLTVLYEENPPVTGIFPHKGSVMWNALLCHDFVMLGGIYGETYDSYRFGDGVIYR